MHSGSDVKVLPVLSLIMVEKLRFCRIVAIAVHERGALIFTDSSLFQGCCLFLPESCTVVFNGGISYWVEAAVFREVSVKSGRPPALNDFKGLWGDPWLLRAGAPPS